MNAPAKKNAPFGAFGSTHQLSFDADPCRAVFCAVELRSPWAWLERPPALRDELLALEDELPVPMLLPMLPPSMPCFWPVLARSAEPFFWSSLFFMVPPRF